MTDGKPKSLRVAAVSCRCAPGEFEANLAHHVRWIERALDRGAEFVGFPESSLTGYAKSGEIAIPIESPFVKAVIRVAETAGVFLSTGLIERRGRRVFNSQLLAGPQGLIGVMRKINLTLGEREVFTCGREFPIFPVGPVRLGIAICADATHYETPHVLALRGAEVIFCPHATYLKHTPRSWLAWRMERWPLMAKDFGAFLVGCNNAGRFERPAKEPDLGFASGALIIGPDGRVVSRSTIRCNRETMLVANLPMAKIEEARKDRAAMSELETDVFYRGLIAPARR